MEEGSSEILNRMVRIGLIEKVMANVRLERNEEVDYVNIWRKGIPGRRKRQPNGRSSLLCFRMNMKAVWLFY